jgi:hypothetical protein
MLRRFFALLALSAVLFGGVGCGGDNNPSLKSSAKKLDSQDTKKTFTPE